MTAILATVAVLVAYLLGSIPSGVIAARLVKGVDVRKIGSGRTGATNAYRAAGPWGLGLTTLGDLLKGIAAVWVARFLMLAAPLQGWAPWAVTLAGIAAVVGHNWSIFLGFRGGAGTSTTVGVLLAINLYVGLGVTIAGLAAVAIARMASVGSITVAVGMCVALLIAAALNAVPWAALPFGVAAGALTIVALRPNILRILRREERELKTDY